MNQINNDFLNSLFSAPEREIYARITALNFQEKPLEFIEGKVTGGSINIDGQSAVRRTCSLTLIAQDVEIHNFYWGLKNKFKLEIGLKNKINSKYPNIIWFKQGIYVITAFNTTISNNSFNINISGKDKMCLLNGDISGALPHTTDFGIEEYHDDKNNVVYKSIPIRRIIYESIQSFGNELPNNIIINDIEDYGLDLLEYRGDIPLYFFKDIKTDIIEQMTVNGKQNCYINGNLISIDSIINYDTLIHVDENLSYQPDIITLSQKLNAKQYTVIKMEYGMNAGYHLTDLVYAGDLILNVGEPLTSLYDKIKNMLGNFEYFYNVDGKFVFQKKRFYINTPWNSNIKSAEQTQSELAVYNNTSIFNLTDNLLVTNIQNTPNLLNLKNDFSVWGTKKNSNGSELPIHMRYAIDIKPTYYKSFNNKIYTIEDYDWRELIYQMALDYRKHYFSNDDFFHILMNNNPQYINGKTGYEQYYTDIEGFWRYLYNPEPNDSEIDIYYSSESENKYWNKEVINNPENLIFWFDFLDAESSDLSKYAVSYIGSRAKVINDKDVKIIQYREIPNVIFKNNQDDMINQPGYTTIQLQDGMENLFTISSKGKSCKERIDELLSQHSHCVETINITTLPIYSLEPNIKLLVKNNKNFINGKYMINKLSIPLTYNGTMTIGAFKVIDDIM